MIRDGAVTFLPDQWDGSPILTIPDTADGHPVTELDTGCFRNWWESGADLKESLAKGNVTDEFASFPSGHSAYAMFGIFLFPALAEYITVLRKYRSWLFLLGLSLWAATAFSRLTVGAHYLTDVTIAGLIAILAYAAVSTGHRILEKR